MYLGALYIFFNKLHPYKKDKKKKEIFYSADGSLGYCVIAGSSLEDESLLLSLVCKIAMSG